jgi:hypothetical protein
MSADVDLVLVSQTLEHLLMQSGRQIAYDCRASRRTITFVPDSAAAPTGLLPAFLTAADAVWREATGKSFGVEVVPDPATVLGFVVRGIHAGTFATVMLAMIEAIEQAADGKSLLVNDLGLIWRQTEDRIARAAIARMSA